MIRMQGIKKVYRTEHVETHALSGFNLEVAEGEFISVMGPSGSGKSTFLNVAGLLDAFDEGTYTLDGADVSKLSDREMSRIRNIKISATVANSFRGFQPCVTDQCHAHAASPK